MVFRLVKGRKGRMIKRERERFTERDGESLTDWEKCGSQGTSSLHVDRIGN